MDIRILHRTPGRLSDMVSVTAPGGTTDAELARAAGFNSSHFGYNVTRYDDATASVCLWND